MAKYEERKVSLGDRAYEAPEVTAFLRRALIVYTVYFRGRENAADWTGVPVRSASLVEDR